MKSFEDQSDRTIPANITKLDRMSGKDQIRVKALDKVRKQLEEIKGKYGRTKSDFILNADLTKVASFRESTLRYL